MNDIHKHRCGLHLSPIARQEGDVDPNVVGCGFEWEHARIYLNEDDYADRHRCPRCGAGPWYARVLPPLPDGVTELIVVEFDAQELRLPGGR